MEEEPAGPEGRRRIVRSWKDFEGTASKRHAPGGRMTRAGRRRARRRERSSAASVPDAVEMRVSSKLRGEAAGRAPGAVTHRSGWSASSSSARRARPWAADGGRRLASVAGTPEGDASARAREKTRRRGGTWCRAFGSPRLGGVGTRRSRPRARTPDVSRRSIRRSARERGFRFLVCRRIPGAARQRDAPGSSREGGDAPGVHGSRQHGGHV